MDKPKIYLDSCYWISGTRLANSETLVKDALEYQLKLVDKGEVILVASPLVFIECLTVDVKRLEQVFDARRGIVISLTTNLARRVRAFQDQTYFRTGKVFSAADAIHLVTASEALCDAFFTEDRSQKGGQLAPLSNAELISEFLSLTVRVLPTPPDEGGQGTLAL